MSSKYGWASSNSLLIIISGKTLSVIQKPKQTMNLSVYNTNTAQTISTFIFYFTST